MRFLVWLTETTIVSDKLDSSIKSVYTFFCFCSFGRKYTTMIFWIGTSSSSFAITVAYFVAVESKFKVYMNVFALISRLSLSAAWQSLLLFTIEAFPTVVRYVISEVVTVSFLRKYLQRKTVFVLATLLDLNFPKNYFWEHLWVSASLTNSFYSVTCCLLNIL